MSNPFNFWSQFLIYLVRSQIRSIINMRQRIPTGLFFKAIFANLYIIYDLDGARI